jgi:hypothetical protein
MVLEAREVTIHMPPLGDYRSSLGPTCLEATAEGSSPPAIAALPPSMLRGSEWEREEVNLQAKCPKVPPRG